MDRIFCEVKNVWCWHQLGVRWGEIFVEAFTWDWTFYLTVQVSLQHSTRAVTPGWAACLPAKISDPATSLRTHLSTGSAVATCQALLALPCCLWRAAGWRLTQVVCRQICGSRSFAGQCHTRDSWVAAHWDEGWCLCSAPLWPELSSKLSLASSWRGGTYGFW